jgi:LysM repeat protein
VKEIKMKRNLALLLIVFGFGCSRVRPILPTPTPTPTSALPTPTLAPTFTPTLPPYITYTVKQGDSPWSIALEFGVTVEALMEANDLSEDTILDVGQELLIPLAPEEATPQPTSSPQGITYTVKPGDSPWSIALEFGVTVEALMEANGLSEDTVLSIGQELIIPQD